MGCLDIGLVVDIYLSTTIFFFFFFFLDLDGYPTLSHSLTHFTPSLGRGGGGWI